MPGHITDPPRSPGKLAPLWNNGNETNEKIMVPEDYKDKVHIGQKVGFHPVRDKSGVVWATDIVNWEEHEQAENAVMKDPELGLKIQKFEDLYFKPELKARVSKEIHQPRFKQHIDTIKKTLNYLDSSHFREFYLKNNNELCSHDEIVAKISGLVAA